MIKKGKEAEMYYYNCVLFQLIEELEDRIKIEPLLGSDLFQIERSIKQMSKVKENIRKLLT